MKKWLASITLVALAVASIGLAVDEDGGGGGGTYTERNPEELRQVLQAYQAQRDALRLAASVSLTEEEEMQQLYEEAFRAQVAQRQAVALTEAHEHEAEDAAASMAALGAVDFHVSCSPEAQNSFNRGLGLLHHMMYAEAEETFSTVAETDPHCAMAHWGVALTLFQPLWAGQPTQETLQRGREAIELAKSLNGARLEADTFVSLYARNEPFYQPQLQRERAYILTLEPFYSEVEAPYGSRLQAFAAGMEGLYASYPDDIDAAAFYALSLLATAPATDKTLAQQMRAAEILAAIRAQEPTHPGGIHYAIHAHDFPPLAGHATDIARSYDQIAPDVPHALHMPSHIFVRLGEWDNTIAWNLRSAEAALNLDAEDQSAQHYAHAMDYLVYAYLQQGADEVVLGALGEISAKTYPSTFAAAYALAAMPARYALERRQWQEAAILPARAMSSITWDNFPEVEAITYFARGIGAARRGDVSTAQEALETLTELQEKVAEAENMYWAGQVEIQRLAVAAWLEHARGNNGDALTLMLASADLEDATEKHPVTPGAVLPARELLGDLYLELGQPAEALSAYEASLLLSPNRLNSLLGAARAAELAGESAKAASYHSRVLELAGETQRTAL